MEFRGAAAQLWTATEPIVVVVGPRGTGKTTPLLHYQRQLAELWPLRIVFVRQHRSEFAGTILPEWEAVLGADHEAVRAYGGSTREHRRWYNFDSGTEVQLVGLDDGGKSLSGEYDIAYVSQAERCDPIALADVLASVRRRTLPWGAQVFYDANPGPPTSYLLALKDRPGVRWLESVLQDNPIAYDRAGNILPWGRAYIEKLESLYSGAQLRRMLHGEWAGAEGLILDQWDRRAHVVEPPDPSTVESYVGSFDWAFGSGGVGSLGVWAIVRQDKMNVHAVRVAETYWRGQTVGWWRERMIEAIDEFKLTRIVADSADGGNIETINTYLSRIGKPRALEATYKPRGSVLTGAGLVNQKLKDRALFVAKNVQRRVDPGLANDRLPTGLVSEIEAWAWHSPREGVVDRERPDPKGADHAIDEARYFASWLWGHEREQQKAPQLPPPPVIYDIEPKIVFDADGDMVTEHVKKRRFAFSAGDLYAPDEPED